QSFADFNGATGERFAGGEGSAGVFEPAQAVTECGCERVFEARSLLRDLKSAAVGGFGLIEMAVVFAEHAEFVEDVGRFEGVVAEAAFRQRECFAEWRGRFFVAAGVAKLAAAGDEFSQSKLGCFSTTGRVFTVAH